MKRYCLAFILMVVSASADARDVKGFDNPMSVSYLETHLNRGHPRLVFTPAIMDDLKSRLDSDPVLRNLYEAIQLNAAEIHTKPLLERKMVGKRLLHTSREMLYRINMLGLVYIIEKDPEILARINEELTAVCMFSDWNPAHFLDVAEMALAVALALDWTDGDLPESTVRLAKQALIEKGIEPSWPADEVLWWVNSNMNWTQVCHGGMIAASIAVAEDRPELAAKTIRRALEAMPVALENYAPDGAYPEGSSYWEYGTVYSVITIAMLESAFGSDFGIATLPGFIESALFRLLCTAPSGGYFNFADCSDRRQETGDVLLAWFATKTGNATFYEKDRFLQPVAEMGKLARFSGAGMAWLAQYREKDTGKLPTAWKGDGANPIVIFRGDLDDPHTYYFGGKGGRATSSHGNMDAGSFVFELDGVRWVVDSGNQEYHALEKTGFNLWETHQEADRWKLLTKNNFGHSTITINQKPFLVNGFAPLIDFKDGVVPEATFELAAVYGDRVRKAIRRFSKPGPASLVIEDRIEVSEATERVTWQLLTVAEVEIVQGGAILRQEGKVLRLDNLAHPEWNVTVVSLDPPPLELDRRIKGLKRLEINIPASAAVDGMINLKIELSNKVLTHDSGTI